MARVTSLSITDSGWGYSTVPSALLSLPDEDSANVTAEGTITNTKLSAVTMIGGRGKYYKGVPRVTTSLPDQDSQQATAIINKDSDGAEYRRGIASLTTTRAGRYYTSAPDVTLTTTYDEPLTWSTRYNQQDPKFGTYMYKLTANSQDSSYTNFSNNGNGVNEKIEFWINIPAQRTGTIIRFPGHEDSAGAGARRSIISVVGDNLKWEYVNQGSGGSLTSSGNELTSLAWHYIQLRVDSDGGHKMYIDGNVADYTDPGATPKKLISGTVQFSNGNTVDGILIDAFRYTHNDSAPGNLPNVFPPSNLPDSDRNPYNYPRIGDSADSDLDYLGFELSVPLVKATIADGRVSGYNIIRHGNYLDSVDVTIDSATGGRGDFQARIAATVNSDEAGTLTLNITDSGNFYDTITIGVDSATGVARDYIAKATVTLDDSGRISALNIVDSGAGYTTAPTVTIQKPKYTNVEQNDSAHQTLDSGIKVTGEILKYSDSDGIIHIGHNGNDDGGLHLFTTGRYITFGSQGNTWKRTVLTVEEENKLSTNEANEYFDTLTDFLDFTENNPFGDPS